MVLQRNRLKKREGKWENEEKAKNNAWNSKIWEVEKECVIVKKVKGIGFLQPTHPF